MILLRDMIGNTPSADKYQELPRSSLMESILMGLTSGLRKIG